MPDTVRGVYFIHKNVGRSGLGVFKIGWSADVYRRLSQLQVGSEGPLELVAVAEQRKPSYERRVHGLFATDRIHGEWFQGTEALWDFVLQHADWWRWSKEWRGDKHPGVCGGWEAYA